MEGKREAEIVESGGVWVFGRNSYLQFSFRWFWWGCTHGYPHTCWGWQMLWVLCLCTRVGIRFSVCGDFKWFFGWIVILWRDTIVQNIHVTFGCLIPWSSLRQNILPSRRRFSSFHPNPNFQNCFSKCVSTPITSLWSFANPNPKKDFFFLSLIRTSACPCPYCCGTFIRHGMKVSFSWSDLFYGFEEPGTSQCLSILILERGSTAQRSNIAYLSVVTLTILQVVSPWRVG